MSNEFYSPHSYKQNTWEANDDGVEELSAMDIAYEQYRRTYLWDLDTPLPRKDFEKRLDNDENFRNIWAPIDY